jgi:hypothetical protein
VVLRQRDRFYEICSCISDIKLQWFTKPKFVISLLLWHGLIVVLYCHCLEGQRKTTKNFSYSSRLSGRYSNPELPERKYEVLPLSQPARGSRPSFLIFLKRYFNIYIFVFFHSVQTGVGAHPASYTVGTGGSFPWVEADHSPPSTVEVMNGGAIPSLPHMSS